MTIQDDEIHWLKQHVDALLLALASSTDNFTVGVAVGICGKNLPVWSNLVISICNASGALAAAHMGITLSQHVPYLAPLLAAIAFGVLSCQEFISYFRNQQDDGEDGHHHQRMIHFSSVMRLALPMTLNNLAGGVAGGAAGISPEVASIYALVASFGTMSVGHSIGKRMGKNLATDPSLIAGILLGLLCLLTIYEVLTA